MKKENAYLILIAVIAGTAYVLTLYPGAVVFANDSARFQFLGKVLGTAHTTGYPLYTVINHFFVKVFPLGNLAYKVNLLSTVFSLLALLFLFKILLLLELPQPNAFLVTLMFASTRMLWQQSVIAEVYTLHLFFISNVLYFFIKWSKAKENKYFFTATFFYAISFGNHLTSITLLPAIIYIVWATDKKSFSDPKKIAGVFLFIVVGAAQYGYLFWRYSDPGAIYLLGQVYDFRSFIDFISGEGWKSKMFGFPVWEIVVKRIPMFFYKLAIEFFYLLFPVGILGTLAWKEKKTNIFLLLCFTGNSFFAINYDIWDIDPYFIPSFFIFSIYVGIGFQKISCLLEKKIKNPKPLVYGMMLFMLVSLLGINFHYNKFYSQPAKITASEKVKDVLKRVGRDSLIIAPDYGYFECLMYYLLGEELEKKMNIYAVHTSQSEEVRDYILKNKAFVLPQQRKRIPLGLKVFCREQDKLYWLHRGFLLEEVMAGLFRTTKKV